MNVVKQYSVSSLSGGGGVGGVGLGVKPISWQEFYDLEEKMDYALSEKVKKILIDLAIAVGIPPGAEQNGNGNGGGNGGRSYHHHENHSQAHNNNNTNNNYSKNGTQQSSKNGMTGINGMHSKPRNRQDLEWENLRKDMVFKPTVMENKEGYEKIINEIRICLNKLTDKNYAKQRDDIFEHIRGILVFEDELSKEGLKRVSNALFDIASTNKFFSKIYAQIYAELMNEFVIFNEILGEFLTEFVNKITTIHYVDPDKDYDGYCLYVKSQDSRRATSGFMIHLGLLLQEREKVAVEKTSNFGKDELWKEIERILMELTKKLEEFIPQVGKLNEVEEIVEILYLISTAGSKKLVVESVLGDDMRDIWRTLATKKVKENPSWSSRAMFKISDLVKLLV
jgi:hypothetical protein